jgi:SAM-dependent methyltransferase
VKAVATKKSSCTLCYSTKIKEIYEVSDRAYGGEEKYQLNTCCACGHTFLGHDFSKEELASFYHETEYYGSGVDFSVLLNLKKELLQKRNLRARFIRSILKERFNYKFKSSSDLRFLRTIIQVIPKWFLYRFKPFQVPDYKENGKLLEVGFGNGGDLCKFISLGWQVQGTEMDRRLCEDVERELGIQAICHVDAEFPFEDNSFDVVYLNQVLEHVSDPLESTQEFHRILKPGGQLIMTFPNFGCLQRRFHKQNWRGIEAPRHLNLFTKTTAKDLLSKSGFKEIKAQSVCLSAVDFFFSSLPPTATSNQRVHNSFWINKFTSSLVSLLGPTLGMGETVYVTAFKTRNY